jgi:hypothetical protein
MDARCRLVVCALVLTMAGCVGRVADAPAGQGGPPPSRDPGHPGGPTPGATGGGGSGGGGGSTTPPGDPPPTGATTAGRLRRLTGAQFRNTVRDLLGADVTVGDLEPDSLREGFASIGATYNTISARGIEQYDTAVQAVAHTVFADPARRALVLGCQPAGSELERCVRSYLTSFGRRAWRRPLTTEELDDYTKVTLDAAQLLGDANQALEQITGALLTSPHFLYRVELGTPDTGGHYRYSGWELASRMSYFTWNSMPDDELLAAAQAGKLETAEGLRAQAGRLLQSPRARTGFSGGFGRELLWLDALDDAPKNDPRFTPALRTAMETEALRLFESRLDPGSDLMELFVSTKTFVDAGLAGLYGLPKPAGTADAQLPAGGPRAGLLGTAAFLSIYSAQDRTSPTARGVFVREKLLCQPMPTPPDNVNITLPPGNLTTRQRLEQHRMNDGCRGCHDVFDPVGFAFEDFDWIGAHRDQEGGVPVDTSGNLDDFKFANARELGRHLREMPEVRDCLLENLFRTLNGHLETDADRGTLAAWKTAFERTNRSLPAFVAEVVAQDGFRAVSNAP